MRKNIIKFIISIIIIINVGVVICLASATSNIVINTNINTTDYSYVSSTFTKKDDLEENTNKGKLTGNDEEIITSSNGKYTLYVNRTLCIFKVKNNLTNYIYSSALDEVVEGSATTTYAAYMSSSFIVEYYKYNTKTNENALVVSQAYMTDASKLSTSEKNALGDVDKYYLKLELDNNVNIEYSNIVNGMNIKVNFTKLEIAFESEIILDNDGLHVIIRNETIQENKNLLTSIITMPGMGATYNNETQGYMVIPDGAGALVRYGQTDPKLAAVQTMSYYGGNMGADLGLINYDMTEPYNLSANVFGLINGIKQDGVYGIIEEGVYHCDLIISPCGAYNIYYNYLACRFIKRYIYLQYGVNQKILENKNSEDIKLLYKFLSNDNATYVGMANDYSDYLVQNGNLIKTSDGEYKTRIDYLLSETSKGIIGSKMNVMTKVSDIYDVSEYLDTLGIKQTTVLKGWNKDGLSGSTPYDIKYNTSVGSKKSFKSLITYLEKNGDVYFYNDYVVGYSKGNINVRNDVARSTQNLKMSFTNTNQTLYQTYYYINPTKAYKISNSDLKKYKNLGINSLAIDNVASNLFTYIENSINKERIDCYNTYNDLLTNISQNVNVGLYQPNSYMYKYLNSYFDMPIYCNSYSFYTDNVPFIPYVLKSYVDMYSSYINFFANTSMQLLRMLDYGVMPSYILTTKASYNLKYTNSVDMFTTNFVDWKNKIASNNMLLQAGYNQTLNSRIVSRDVLEEGVVLIEYENNKKLLINYTNKDITYQNYTVAKVNYLVIGE